jgi:hypothetical protein
MKALIAGLGSIGRRHFRNLIALGENALASKSLEIENNDPAPS